jgi:hypothetical protein
MMEGEVGKCKGSNGNELRRVEQAIQERFLIAWRTSSENQKEGGS